jgi:hypothetical protein
MSDPPSSLSLAQLEAQTILTHLLFQLSSPSSKYYPRYGQWIERHPHLPAYLFHTIRPQVWTFLQNRWSLDALKLISGDLRSDSRAIYLNGVLGLDKRVRVYVGQSMSLRQRVAQHLNFRYRRDNPSLHYHALQYSVYNAIAVLAVLPAAVEKPELVMNVLEMWMCLVFRTLPEESLSEWLPSDGTINTARKEGKEGLFGGLNIACPVDQGVKNRTWVDLSKSEDPLVREYLETARKSSGVQSVKKEEEDKPAQHEVVQRKERYKAKAKRYRESDDGGIIVPPWLVFGVVAVVAGFFLLKSNGGPQPSPRPRWR